MPPPQGGHIATMGSMPAVLASGQGWHQIGDLALAFALSAAIGLEREWRQKSAGLRTHTLVGVGSALFVLVSKYGFGDVLEPAHSVLDPSRVAAQVVSGIGFIGGGADLRAPGFRGLTTAAIVWVTCAIGMACGAGLALLALVATAGHFVVVFGFPAITSRLPMSGQVLVRPARRARGQRVRLGRLTSTAAFREAESAVW